MLAWMKRHSSAGVSAGRLPFIEVITRSTSPSATAWVDIGSRDFASVMMRWRLAGSTAGGCAASMVESARAPINLLPLELRRALLDVGGQAFLGVLGLEEA